MIFTLNFELVCYPLPLETAKLTADVSDPNEIWYIIELNLFKDPNKYLVLTTFDRM